MNRRLLASLLALATTSFAFAGTAFAQDVNPEDPSAAGMTAPPIEEPVVQQALPTTERVCDDGQDQDGDGNVDCADADCFSAANCQAGGSDERTDRACSDWIDNDGDGASDCDDADCQADTVRVCRGSWPQSAPGGGGTTTVGASGMDDLPELPEGATSAEDLVGQNGDLEGERNDAACSDGIDNDGDGRVDCADYGCRFDPDVSICQTQPGLRFSVVGGVGGGIQLNFAQNGQYANNQPSAGFTLLQLRALGPIPFINNSFFLIQMRADVQLRVNFILFRVPINNNGYYLALNSGSGLLTTAFVVSAANYPLLNPPYYMSNIVEPGNGFSLELGGPLADTTSPLNFRLFAAAGSGEGTGNVGGRFYRSDDRNFSWSGGGQLLLDVIGRTDRFDSLFVYTPNPHSLQFTAGARFDQRPNERMMLWQAGFFWRYTHFLIRGDYFGRYVLDYNALNHTFNVSASVLLVPRILMFAADIGGVYRSQGYQNLPTGERTPNGVTYVPEQTTWRAGLTWFFFRRTGILSLVYGETYRENDPTNPLRYPVERTVNLESRFRF